MTQIIIRDARWIKKIVRTYENRAMREWQREYTSADHIIEQFPAGIQCQGYFDLRDAIQRSPSDEAGNTADFNMCTFLAQHMSGAPYIRRVYTSDAQTSGHSFQQLLLAEMDVIWKAYMRGEIRGDLVIFKTESRGSSERIAWPLVRTRRTKTECWFITGLCGWIEQLNHFTSSPVHNLLASRMSADELKHWLKTTGKMSHYLVDNLTNTSELRLLFRRAYWVNTLRRYYNSILWDTIVSNIEHRAGVCYYLNGRAYFTPLGDNQIEHDVIRLPSRRYNYKIHHSVFPLKPWVQSDRSFRQNYASTDDPDFVQRYIAYKRGEGLGVFERDSSNNLANSFIEMAEQADVVESAESTELSENIARTLASLHRPAWPNSGDDDE
tara:strand:+ start:1184 stop:2326 length:1143 start_codon:yes stop_codon:yes gene_type:complete